MAGSLHSVGGEVAGLGLLQQGPGSLKLEIPTLPPFPVSRPCGPWAPPCSRYLPTGLGFGVRSSQSLSGSLAIAYVSLDWMQVPNCLGNRLGAGVGAFSQSRCWRHQAEDPEAQIWHVPLHSLFRAPSDCPDDRRCQPQGDRVNYKK